MFINLTQFLAFSTSKFATENILPNLLLVYEEVLWYRSLGARIDTFFPNSAYGFCVFPIFTLFCLF